MREPSHNRPDRLQPPGRLCAIGWLACLAFTLAAPDVQANIIQVAASAVGPGGSGCSLVDAINAANSNTATGGCPAGDDKTNGGDVILLAAGTYKIASADNDWYGPNGLPVITSKITIVGDPKGTVIMRKAGQGVSAFRIFYVGSGASLASYNPPTDFSSLPGPGNLTLINLTVENGLAQGGAGGASALGSAGGGLGAGGAIYNQGTLTLEGVTLVGNQAIGGAGGGSSTTNNGDPGGGGGMAGAGDGFGNGGGFSTNGSWPDSTTPPGDFGNGGSSSQAGGVGGGGGSSARGGFGGGGGGGGIGAPGGFGGGGGGFSPGGFGGGAIDGGGAGLGGAIFNEGGILTLLNCTLTANNAGGGAGGLAGLGNGLGLGGAIFNLNGRVNIGFSTLANNTLSGTSGDGGALYSLQVATPGSPAADAGASASVTVSSSILYGSDLITTDSSGNITIAATTDCISSGGNFSGTPNILGATSASCFLTGDVLSNPVLLPLGANGGPTQTMALVIGPAINAGNASGAPPLDQRGYLRDAAPDIGAYEVSNTLKSPPTFSGLQTTTLIAGNAASPEWFNLSGNDALHPQLTLATNSSNTSVLPAANLTLSSSCGASPSLDSCSISITPTAMVTGSATVTLSATDGYGQTGYGSFAVSVIPPFPVAKNAKATVASGQTLNGTLTATDTLNVTLSYAIVTQPAHGTLKLSSASSAYTYTPANGYLGADSFTWKANDGSSDSNIATVSITVSAPPPPPGAPTVSDMALTVSENTPLSGTLQGNGTSLSYAIAGNPSHGAVTITNTGTGAFTYTPTSGYTGADSFSYTAENTLLKATSNPATVSLTISAISGSGGTAPVASAMSLTTYAGTPVSGVLAASDAAGNVLNYVVTQPTQGTVTLGNAATGAFTYTPNAGYTGADSFTFIATDTVTGLTSASTGVSLTVMAVPVSSTATPLANNASFTTYVDIPVDGSLSASDAAGNALNYTLAAPPAHGTVTVTAASGDFVYTPSSGYTGNDSFSFTANDTVSGVSSAAATVALTVDALPPPAAAKPTANGMSIATYENAAVNGSLTASDAAGNALTYAIGTAAAHGAVSGLNSATGAFTYTPTAGYIGGDSFTFNATDGATSLVSDSATVTLAVNALPPPAPVAGGLAVSTYAGVPVSAVLPASDGAGNTMTYTFVTLPAHSTPTTPVLNASTGAITYTPTSGYTGSDSLRYTVSDNVTHVVSASATVTFSISPVPASPAAPLANNAAVTVYENKILSSALSAVAAPSGDTLSYSITSPPTHGALSPIGSGGAYTYTPTSNYAGPDSFAFAAKDVTDGVTSAQAGVVITVASAPPPATPPQASGATLSLYAGQSLSGSLVAVDAAGHAVSFSVVQPGHGVIIVIAATGAFTYTPTAGYTGADSFTFTAIDTMTSAASAAATVSVAVNPLPITGVAPLANSGSLTIYSGQPFSGQLAAVDAAGNALSYAISTQPTHGSINLTASAGAYTFTPAAGYTGKDSFSFTATDGVTHLVSSAATVSITVVAPPLQAVAPLANDLNLTLYSGQAFSSVLSAVDVNGNPMGYAITTQPTHGTVSLTAGTGAFVYTPSGGYTGSDSFAYTATDTVSNLTSSAASATLTVTPAPPTPVHHGGPGLGGYGLGYLLILLVLIAWRRGVPVSRRARDLMLALGYCTLLWPVSAAAADGEPQPSDAWYAGGQINIIKPAASRGAATHGLRGWGLLIGKDIGDYSLEFNGAYHADNPRGLRGLANWKTYGADGMWFFTGRQSSLFSPFADAGLGVADAYYGDNSKLRKAYLALGAGFDSAPWHSVPVTLRTDLQLQHVLGSYNDLVLSFGATFSFGGTPPPAEPAPLPDASPLDKYPMAWCTQEGGQPQQTDSGWVCYLPGGKTESQPGLAAPPAASTAPPPVAAPGNLRQR